MRRNKALLAALALAAIAAAPASAADYDPPIYVDNAPEVVPVEIGSGWYLRGDVGYAFSTSAKGAFNYRTYDTATGTYGASTFDNGALNTDFSLGLGFGYHFNDWLRADITGDWFETRFAGTTTSGAPCSAAPVLLGTTCRSEDQGTGTAVSVMANGYVDLGTVKGFTPYVGAGVGYTYIRWDGLKSNYYCVDGAATCPAGFVGAGTNPGEQEWAFTYAAMAGIAFDVTKNMKIDVGYKYRHIGSGQMFGFNTAGATGTQGSHPDITQHVVTLGLRYDLW